MQTTPGVRVESSLDLAGTIKGHLERGELGVAREQFAIVVAQHQRRALRVAVRYLRDAADADEAVQDAFTRAFAHLPSFREELPFEAWFTRILVNACLDRLRARRRRAAISVPLDAPAREGARFEAHLASAEPSPEARLLARERRAQIDAALERLPERQRSVFILSHYDGRTPREVSAVTGLNESTVRVHLFRAIRKLRKLLVPQQAT